MSRTAPIGLLALVTLAGAWTVVGRPAEARPEYKRLWDKKYFTAGSAMDKTYEFSSCNFCHIGGADDRKHRNDYGQALAKLLKKEDTAYLSSWWAGETPDLYKRAVEKVIKAFETVETQHSNPEDKTSPTFGELIKKGKLPKSPLRLPEK